MNGTETFASSRSRARRSKDGREWLFEFGRDRHEGTSDERDFRQEEQRVLSIGEDILGFPQEGRYQRPLQDAWQVHILIDVDRAVLVATGGTDPRRSLFPARSSESITSTAVAGQAEWPTARVRLERALRRSSPHHNVQQDRVSAMQVSWAAIRRISCSAAHHRSFDS